MAVPIFRPFSLLHDFCHGLPGLSLRLRTLVVCHCYREAEDMVRIISARRANRSEQLEYKRRIFK